MNTHVRPSALNRVAWKTILGVRVADLRWGEAIGLLAQLLEEGRFTRVGFLNAHNANVAATDPALARAFEESLVLPDGVGVDIASKILHGSPFAANLNGTDFIPEFLRQIRWSLRVGLIGAKGPNVERALARFQLECPQHRFILINDGYFSAAEEPAIVERIRTIRPDILLVAMGVPAQELWIRRNIDERHCTLAMAVGALFDFMSGAVPRAPRFVRAMRLEWLFRLMIEPVRLWRRYVLGNPMFIARVLRQRFSAAGSFR